MGNTNSPNNVGGSLKPLVISLLALSPLLHEGFRHRFFAVVNAVLDRHGVMVKKSGEDLGTYIQAGHVEKFFAFQKQLDAAAQRNQHVPVASNWNKDK